MVKQIKLIIAQKCLKQGGCGFLRLTKSQKVRRESPSESQWHRLKKNMSFIGRYTQAKFKNAL